MMVWWGSKTRKGVKKKKKEFLMHADMKKGQTGWVGLGWHLYFSRGLRGESITMRRH